MEPQIQWDMAQKTNKDLKLEKLILPGKRKRVAVGYNKHERIERSQHGGTAAVALDRMVQFVMGVGTDPHGLGRWVWIQIGAGEFSTRIVVAYLPCKTARHQRKTVYNQQGRHFRKLGDRRCPRTIFVQHLGEQIALWKQAGEQVLLFVDANSDVYDGILATRLSQSDIRMTEQCRKILGHKSPNSHSSGVLPITGIFATSGINCSHVLQSAHSYGIGDHRTFILDVEIASLLGPTYSKIIRQPGRKLQAKRRRMVKAYNKSLRQNILRHKIIEKYDTLRLDSPNLPEEVKQHAINKLDNIKSQFMVCGENGCNKKRVGKLACSPLISAWWKRRRLLQWIQRHVNRPLHDPRNLFRRVRTFNKENPSMAVRQPRDYTLLEVTAQIKATTAHIAALEDAAPDLRRKHLKSRKLKAEEEGRVKAAKEIATIISNEDLRDRYANMKLTTRPRKGGGKVFCVERVEPDGTVKSYNTKPAIEAVAAETIEARYKLAYSAPIMSNPKLLEDVGFTGDGDAVMSILQGTYEFPPGTDEYTKLLLLEAAVLFCSLGEDGIEDWVRSQDFQHFWLHAREATESSKSGLHFGHYMAAAHDKVVTRMHVSSLNTIRECGVSPDRWKGAVTVLLEKVFGVRLVDKLRAICLLEADFNWLNKLIFARRLETHCRKHGIIPPEQFCKSKSNCEEASLVKNLINDHARILHNTLGETSADLDQCFDRSNAPISGIAVRAHGISLASTRLMLSTMQLMQYFIKTGFGLADDASFGGTLESRLMSLGQGSGAAPMGMRCIITLADNAYKRLGHGMSCKSAIHQRIFILAAIIYVDDTDLFHWAQEYGISDEVFQQDVQRATTDWGMIVQATGGAIKPSKSFWYMLSWKFVRGVPKLKEESELPPNTMTIPQPDGSSAPIPRKPNSHTAKTLGVWNNPLNNPDIPLDKMQEKGLDWVDRLRVRPLERRDTRLSLTSQQYPKLSYGLSSLYAPPDALDEKMGKVYYEALPFLGFNRHINTEYRTLPRQFQGANLRQWSVEKMSKDIALLLDHWGSDSTLGMAFALVYEDFLMEVGLDGNILDRSFSKLSPLASHSWFKILWEYCDKYQVKLTFNEKFHIPKLRQNDRALMELFLDAGLPMETLIILNRVRRYLRVHSLADILMADGSTVNKELAISCKPATSNRVFSWEQPTPSDLTTWRHSIRLITSVTLTVSPPLGPFLASPHIPYEFMCSDDESTVFHIFDGGYDSFKACPHSRPTRSGIRYTKISTSRGLPPATRYASVVNYYSNSLVLQSSYHSYNTDTHPRPFLTTLFSSSNTSLWEDLVIDDGGEWIIHSLLNGTLIGGDDGSYMPESSKEASSGAFILYCKATGKEARGTFAEHSPESSNYRGELLGSLGPLLLILAAIKSNPQISPANIPPVDIYCDNKGLLSHGNSPLSSLKAGQK